MKVHAVFESNDITNGRVVGAWTDSAKAKLVFDSRVSEVATDLDDSSMEVDENDSCWSYLPEGSETKVMLFLSVEVTE